MSRLRGSNPTSTLSPDAGNAAVGSHRVDFLQEVSRGYLLFFFIFGKGEMANILEARFG